MLLCSSLRNEPVENNLENGLKNPWSNLLIDELFVIWFNLVTVIDDTRGVLLIDEGGAGILKMDLTELVCCIGVDSIDLNCWLFKKIILSLK